MQESNQTAPSSLTYAPTKHSTRLQPTLVTKRREKGSCHRLPRRRAPRFPCANRKVPKAGMCHPRLPAQPLGTHGSQRLCRGWVQGEGTHVTGAGCLQQHLQGAFYTNLFLYRVVKKNKIEAPIGCSYRSLGFFGWVTGFKTQQHMLFPLPSHSLPSQPP